MQWMVGADGEWLTLTTRQALLIDLRCNGEDLQQAIERMRDMLARTSALVQDSARQRRLRQTRLHLVQSRG